MITGKVPPKKRPTTGKKRRTIFLSFFLFLLILTLVFGYAMNHTLNRIGKVVRGEEVWIAAEAEDFETADSDTGVGEDTLAPESVVWVTPTPRPETAGTREARVTNILLIGQDRRPGELRARSDSMILCSINQDTDEIVLTSLMRDMYVPFPGDYSDNRINAAYAFGGMSLLDQLIEEDFGIQIDGNVEVDFGGFIEAMNLIAPLEIELKDYEAWYLNKNTGWNLRTGVNALNAEQLLSYARIRNVGHGDWDRTERQRTVLSKAFEKARQLSLKELTDLMDAMLPCVSTDMSNADMLRLLYTVATKRMEIAGNYRIPVDGTYTEEIIYGMAVLVPDLEANSKELHRYIYGDGT